MKFKGKKLDGPSQEVLVIPKGGEEVVFFATMVRSYDEFEKLCPRPEPPKMLKPGSADPIENSDDPNYLEEQTKWGGLRTNWMLLKSLEGSPDLEWETIDMTDPATFDNWTTELDEAGFSEVEKIEVLNLVTKANGLSTEHIEEATASFLARQAEEASESV